MTKHDLLSVQSAKKLFIPKKNLIIILPERMNLGIVKAAHIVGNNALD